MYQVKIVWLWVDHFLPMKFVLLNELICIVKGLFMLSDEKDSVLMFLEAIKTGES